MKKLFDEQAKKQYFSHIIENEYLKIEVLEYGATLVRLIVKQLNRDVILGFDDLDGYQNRCEYMGATIGRNANRIGNGQFTLNGKKYELVKNNNGNHLHGGDKGFNDRIFTIEETDNELICTYVSEDMEEGYPGKLNLVVRYRLEANKLIYEYKATSDQDTLCNITNHAFFNLNGHLSTNCLDHLIMIDSDEIACVDANGLTLNERMLVDDTPFDFKNLKPLGADIDKLDQQLINGSGYDHNYLLNNSGFEKVASCEVADLKMDIYTDLNNMHLYSSNFLEANLHGKDDSYMGKRSSVCFETQYYPNAINYLEQKAPILHKDEIMQHKTQFEFIVKGK